MKRGPFNQTITGLGRPIRVSERRLHGPLGSFNTETFEVLVEAGQPVVGKHVVLLHEFLHLVDEAMRRSGVRKRRMDHALIRSLAPNLFVVLASAGIWRGVSKAQAIRFVSRLPARGAARKERSA